MDEASSRLWNSSPYARPGVASSRFRVLLAVLLWLMCAMVSNFRSSCRSERQDVLVFSSALSSESISDTFIKRGQY